MADNPAPTPAQISVLLTHVGVNMGDHAQDITKAVEIRDDEKFGDAIRRLLQSDSIYLRRPQYEQYLTIRLVEPATPDPAFDTTEAPF